MYAQQQQQQFLCCHDNAVQEWPSHNNKKVTLGTSQKNLFIMGCTSSKSQVVVANIQKNEGQSLNANKIERDANNNAGDNDGRRNIGEGDTNDGLQNVDKLRGSRERENKVDNKRLDNAEKETREDDKEEDDAKEKVQTSDETDKSRINKEEEVERRSPLIVAETEASLGLETSSRPSTYNERNEDSKPLQDSVSPVEKTGKYKLFSSIDDFKDIDLHALQAPKDKLSSFEELASYLTNQFTSDLHKVRSIWRWVTSNISYDTDAFFSNNISAAADENNALKTGKAVCSGYSSLVSALCSCCALDCKEIHGFAKGYSYQIGDSFKGAKTNHSWTAIKIQGQWWLFDFTWGAGYVGSDRNFVWDYNEHYFMTDPEVFILDHYPKEDEWQLVERRYSIEDFEKWAKFHKHFFIHQLEVSSHRDGLVTSDDGEVEIMLSTNIPVQISSKLEFIDDDTIRVLSNYSFTYLKDRSAVFSARLSQKGRYYLKLYASKLTKDSKKSYDMVTQYQIESTRPFPDSKPFPKTFSSWVPGYILYEPMDGVLPKGKANKFKIVAHDVVEMHVCATGGQGEWTALKETTKGIWEGDVVFDNSITEATVVVKVEGQTSTTYSGILKYIVE